MQASSTSLSMSDNSVTQRELEVLRLISLEYTTAEISQTLFISSHTVSSHRKHLMRKLSVRNSAGLVRRGFELKYLTIE